ncbi:MAG TPA: UDP-2,3-diacylglucosamine diphosphatase [Gemmatimonadaceae bacterium]|nr:UDP-2,3-diacylglucosamine diphosphatase [Gemmatimonadaceae bacterium]
MLDAPCYVFSDAHLGAASAERERGLVSFLRSRIGQPGSLVVNGDLFDFWFEWRRVEPRGHFRTLAALADLRDAGTRVLYVGGNHDCWGGDLLTKDVGVDFHLGPWSGPLGGWRALVEHGDGLREREDRAYRRLRTVLRNRWAIRAFRWIHPDWSVGIAAGSSDVSRLRAAGDGGKGLDAIAMRHLTLRHDLDLVIFGHSHVPALRGVRDGVYANPGAWMDEQTFLVVRPERVELRRWTGSAEGDLLDFVDRGAEKTLSLP